MYEIQQVISAGAKISI